MTVISGLIIAQSIVIIAASVRSIIKSRRITASLKRDYKWTGLYEPKRTTKVDDLRHHSRDT